MTWKLIVFDFDGTLVDTSFAITKAINEVSRERNLPKVDVEQVRKAVGGGIGNTLKVLFGEKYEDSLVESFRKYYLRFIETDVRLFEGMDEVVSKLHDAGRILTILSNAHTTFIRTILNRFNIAHCFCDVYGIDRTKHPKPSDRGLRMILEKFELPKEKVIMIGDSEYDVQTSLSVGIDMIFTAWGYGRNVQAKYIAREPKELLSILL